MRKSAKRCATVGHDRSRRSYIRGRKPVSKISGIFTSVAAAALSIALMGATAHADPILVGLITKTNTNPFFVKMREGFEAKAKELGVTTQALAGKFDGDNDGQVAAIEQLIAAGAKGILIVPSNSTAIVPTIEKARKAGILVITLDTPLDPVDRRRRQFRHRQLQGGRADRPMGEGDPRRQGQDGQDRDSRPHRQPADRRLPAPQRLPHRLWHSGQGSQALRDERQPADRRLRPVLGIG